MEVADGVPFQAVIRVLGTSTFARLMVEANVARKMVAKSPRSVVPFTVLLMVEVDVARWRVATSRHSHLLASA